MRIHLQILMVLSLALLVFSGCSDDGIGRSVMEVTAVNDGAPFVSAQLDAGGDLITPSADDFVPAGHCLVRIRNRAYNDFVTATADEPFGAFVIDRIAIEWQPLVAGVGTDLPNRTYDFGAVVPRGEEIEFMLMLVSFDMKATVPSLVALTAGGNPFTSQARVTFTGHDSGATDTFYSFNTTIPVEFIGVIVE